MIGGTDVYIPTRGGSSALDVCLRLIRRIWPSAVFENALTGEKADRYELLPLGGLDEVLVYQDERIAREWDEMGANPSLINTMLHLLLSAEAVTVVVDDAESPAMAQLLQLIRYALQMDILNLTAETKRRAA